MLRVLEVVSCSSTNDEIKAAAQRVQEDLILWTANQTGGRGKRARKWESKAGHGLALSAYLHSPRLEPFTGYTLVAALAVVHLLEELGLTPKVKWPNDILIGGRKICGILCEAQMDHRGACSLIIGIGINVKQREGDFPVDLRDKATSLEIEESSNIRIDKIAEKLAISLQREIERAERRGIPMELLKEYNGLLQKQILIETGGKEVTGIVTGIDPANRLILQTDQGPQWIVSGEIIKMD
ncbi:MAG: biotin--[acetyl-CoA-carboxylase] ligase [Tissierellia bacterium]|nr:biotin--[acetyl-CoA-carboxylase] ligase [Tissierellia bacterium]